MTPSPKAAWTVLCVALLAIAGALRCAAADTTSRPLAVTSPADYQVLQRNARNRASVAVSGRWDDGSHAGCQVEARLVADAPGDGTGWHSLKWDRNDPSRFAGTLQGRAGGWYRVEIRVRRGTEVRATAQVPHLGIGEVFVVAGQSNAANHGEERQRPRTGLVSTFVGPGWRLAGDPQPGATGDGGSFLPPFGDAIAERFHVPVGLVATAVGATSVREWLPQGDRFPNPPTLTGNVTALPSGEWESRGQLFTKLVARMQPLGPHGFRALLWHQGESDAHQRDASRTLSGTLYARYMTRLIEASRSATGWSAPWFVAQVSYHTPDDTGSEDLRQGQASLWRSGIALQGPDTDQLTGDLRDAGGKGVHFSGKGLREHARRWSERVIPWMESQPGVRRR
jgi:hypothetical protein